MARQNFETAAQVKSFLSQSGLKGPIKVRAVTSPLDGTLRFLVSPSDVPADISVGSAYDSAARTNDWFSSDRNETALRLVALDKLLTGTNARAEFRRR
jgi:hypothetical protein